MTTGNGSGPAGAHDQPERPPLRTEPRPFWMHVAVDALIAFCVTAFLLWLFGAPLWLLIVLAWVLGLAAAPFTRRYEAAQLAERSAGD
ncbi:MAG TPA: hypothetical protein VIH82_09480 [Acidimicrobiia bacterium]